MKFFNRLYSLPLFPFLLPLFYVLHTSSYFYGEVPAVGATEVVLLYTLITILIYGIIRKCSKHSVGAGLATVLIMTLFIYWGEIVKYINKQLHTENYTHLPLLLLVWCGIALIADKLLNRQPINVRNKFTFYFNALFLLYIGFEVIMVGFQAWNNNHKRPMIALTDTEIDQHIPKVKSPDVYLLLMDEYASSKSLKEEWNFDNSGIDSALTGRHFKINADSRSNYQSTFFSMASMLNMDYLDTVFEHKQLEYADYPRFQKWLFHPRVVTNFLKAGYEFHNLSIFEIEGQPKPELQDILVNRRDLLTVNNFYHLLVKHYIPYFKNRNARKTDPNFHDPAFYYMDIYNRKRVAEVIKEAGVARDNLKFVYAHIESPHFPFYYDSSGNYLPVSVASAATPDGSLGLYLNNVRQTNRLVLKMVDTILTKTKGNAVILVLGDHGFRTRFPTKNKDAIFRNYSAVYLPDKNYSAFPDSITNVNVFRALFNQLFKTSYPLLPNHCVKLREATH